MHGSGDTAARRAAGTASQAIDHLQLHRGLPHVDETAVAVLLLDTETGMVTYANPAALAMTGDRASLPARAEVWSRAAGLRPARDGGPADREWSDPVATVAAGGTVSGMKVHLDGGDRPQVHWVTGSPLLSSEGAHTGAIVALFPVRRPPGDAPRAGAVARDPAVLGGADGAAVARAEEVARAAVDDEALREATEADTPRSARDVDELTARALLASSISFSISDPRREGDPLIWVNPAFERMTGYTAQEVVGRNCRFLQGPGTDREEVGRIREALEARESVRAELLNYRADGTAFWNALAISPVLDGQGRLSHFVGVQSDVTARVLAGLEHDRLLAAEREARTTAERTRAQLDVLVRLGGVLGETLDGEEAMRRLAAVIVPDLADFCVVDVFDGPDGPPADASNLELLRLRRRVATAHVDPRGAELLVRTGLVDLNAPETSLVPRAVRTGRAMLVPDIGEQWLLDRASGDEELLALLRSVAPSSGAVIPMVARGRVIGALGIGTVRESGRRITQEDLGLAGSIAARAALAMDNARLFAAESAQRRRADALAAAGAALAGSLRSADVVDVLLERVVPAFADWACIHVDESASPTLRRAGATSGLQPAAARHADPLRQDALGALLDAFEVTPSQEGPGRAWSTNTSQLLASIDESVLASPLVTDGHRAALRELGITSLVAVPLTARGGTFGVLTAVRGSGAAFSTEELHLITELGRRGALALENARLYESERVVALELQRSLLPVRLPRVPGLDVAGRYLAGAAGTEVGGDWYDVVPLPDGRVAVAVGDVMGRGVRAAAVMGQLRAALRSYAVEGLGPAQVLQRMAAFTDILEGEHLVTCVVGVHDARDGTVVLASAGHPPPLRITPDGESDYVGVEPGLPLGVPTGLAAGSQGRLGGGSEGARRNGWTDSPPAYDEIETKLPVGAALLLFTDGLVEDRDIPVGAGMQRLAEAMRGIRVDSADDLCETALRAMGRDASHDDDTALLGLRAVEPARDEALVTAGGGPLRLRLDPEPAAAGRSRHLVRTVFTERGMEALADTAVLLVSELVSNAVRHGEPPLELFVDVDPDGATVAVSDASPDEPRPMWDEGAGRPAPGNADLEETGRGLVLVRALADDHGWQAAPGGGKSVWFRLRREGHLAAGLH